MVPSKALPVRRGQECPRTRGQRTDKNVCPTKQECPRTRGQEAGKNTHHYPHLPAAALATLAPTTMSWSLAQPRQIVSQPGGPSDLRFWCPPRRATASRNSAAVVARAGSCHRHPLSTATYSAGARSAAGVCRAPGSRAASRRFSSSTATTLKSAITGCSRDSSVSCGSSTPHPVFCPLWYSSITGRRAYHPARSFASTNVSVSTFVSSTHSSGFSPAGGSSSLTCATHTDSGSSPWSPARLSGTGSVTGPAATRTTACRAARAATPGLAGRAETLTGIVPRSGSERAWAWSLVTSPPASTFRSCLLRTTYKPPVACLWYRYSNTSAPRSHTSTHLRPGGAGPTASLPAFHSRVSRSARSRRCFAVSRLATLGRRRRFGFARPVAVAVPASTARVLRASDPRCLPLANCPSPRSERRVV